MGTFTVTIKPLTPIWTGDANRNCTTLRETGIIGSLRWWYEALIRGLGGTACDPTNTKCEEKNHCDACKLFGCTGWARKFRFEINALVNSYAPFVIVKPPNSKKPNFLGYYDNSGINYKNNGGLLGEYELKFVTENNKEDLIKLLLLLSTKWGFGSGIPKGFGIAHINDEIKFDDVNLFLHQNDSYKKDYKYLPSINEFFFYRIPFKNEMILKIKETVNGSFYKTMNDSEKNQALQLPNNRYIPTSPWIRYSIRELFRKDNSLRHFMMGFVGENNPKPIHIDCLSHSIVEERNNQNKYYCLSCKHGQIDKNSILEKTGSKIFVSHIYNKNIFSNSNEPEWEMKLWGWVPNFPNKSGIDRDNIKRLLKDYIEKPSFWQNTFGIQNNPVIIENIWKIWDIDPRILIKSESEIYE